LLVTRTPRRLAFVAAAGLAALALTGCGDSPIRAGAAATVGDVRIDADALDRVVTRGLADPLAQDQKADKEAFQRMALGRLIEHQLLVEVARREQVFVTPALVDAKSTEFEQGFGGKEQLRQEAAKQGLAPQDLRQFIADQALRDVLGDKLTKDLSVPQAQLQALYQQSIAKYERVHAAHILVGSEALAKSILAQVKADPTQFAALAAKYSTDTSNKDKGGDLATPDDDFVGRGQFVKEFDAAVFTAKPGDPFIVKTEFGYHVVKVIERRTTTLAQATPELRRGVLREQIVQAVGTLESETAGEIGVKVNPRFGRWNSTDITVEPIPVDGNSVSSPAPSPGGVPADGSLVPGGQQQPPADQQQPPGDQQQPPPNQQPPPTP
jgi:parvulin-like peptidyl-prolyl isomerase